MFSNTNKELKDNIDDLNSTLDGIGAELNRKVEVVGKRIDVLEVTKRESSTQFNDLKLQIDNLSNNVEKIKIPMFIVQGENDPRVPVTESKQVVAALRDQGETVWFMNALNEGHGYRKKENRDVYQQATVLFLKEHLIGNE